MNHSVLNLLNKVQSLRSLKSVQALLLIGGSIASSDIVLNKLIRLYSRFSAIDHARKLFDEITQPNSFLWTALIHGYVENRQYAEALSLFRRMRSNSVEPLNFTVASVVKACTREDRLRDVEAVYGFVLKFGFGFDLIVQNALIDAFMKSGKVDSARRLFDELGEKDVISWNSMVAGYGSNGSVDIARELFDEMPDRNIISWTSMICGYIKDRNMLEANFLFERMPKKDLATCNVMIAGHIDAGDIVAARRVFDSIPSPDVGSWNLMASGFCRSGDIECAREYFNRMPSKNIASWTIMIDGYMRAKDVNSARSLFDQMPEKNLISWSTMIEGFARNGMARDALVLYEQFKGKGIKPDETFLLAIISACSQLGTMGTAESIISDFLGTSAFSNLKIATGLIDMYAKCGSIDKAWQVFEMVHKKDLMCYSTMIQAYANHGLTSAAISLFGEMQNAKVRPDGVAFLGVLTACNHGGLVDEGKKYYKQMTEEYGIQPSEKHYACIVDLLGRAGLLEEAYSIIKNMPIVPHAVVWGALLSACRVHRNIELAETAASELFKIEPDNSGNYILMSSIYAACGRWDGVGRMRAMIREYTVRKNKGSSWIELESAVHEFAMGDTSHIDSENIYFFLGLLVEDLKHSFCVLET